MKQKDSAYRFIRHAALRIGQKFHPDKVVLFGSYASGSPKRDSDIDLLVIFPRSGNRARRYTAISRELEPMSLPVDLLIRSTKDIQSRLKMGDSFIKEIMDSGKVIYES